MYASPPSRVKNKIQGYAILIRSQTMEKLLRTILVQIMIFLIYVQLIQKKQIRDKNRIIGGQIQQSHSSVYVINFGEWSVFSSVHRIGLHGIYIH